LFSFIQVKFDDRFDSAATHDAGSAESHIAQPILTRHQGRNDQHGAFVVEDGLADSRDAGGYGKAGIALEERNCGTGIADGNQQLFMRGQIMCAGIAEEGNSRNPGPAPYGDRRVSVFADDGGMNGARVNLELLAEDMAKTLGVEKRAGAYDLAG
jgi:hypothetical protein